MSTTTSPPSLRDRRRAETAREIVAAAMALFASKGFDAATADDIAQQAGISRATFFNYFPQKELILADFARARLERIHSLLDARGALSLDALLQLFISFAEENERATPHGRGLLPQTVLRPACQQVLQPLFASVQKGLAEGLERGGELRADVDARVFAESFFGLYLTTTLQWSMHPDPPKGWHKRTMRQRLGQLIQLARKEGAA
ncbi:MAG: TetR family transcriptional regulator [Acidobacteriota bacterium]